MANFVLIRLARTSEGEKIHGRDQGVLLSKIGQKQAKATSKRLSRFKVDAVYSSASRGCIETAAIIAKPHGLDVISCEELKEIGLGVWEGKTRSEMQAIHPELYSKFWDKVPHNSGDLFLAPGGESRNQVRDRALKKINSIVAELGAQDRKNVVLVSHGHLIKILICHFLGIDYSYIWRLDQPNCGINLFSYDGREAYFYTVGDVAHFEREKDDIQPTSVKKEKAGLGLLGRK